MNLKKICFAFAATIIMSNGYQVSAAERTMFLNLCQELVNSARSYEARASAHSRMAKTVQIQIENMARLPKNDGSNLAMDNFFSQYDENRAMEIKFRELYRQATEEAKKCMKSAD